MTDAVQPDLLTEPTAQMPRRDWGAALYAHLRSTVAQEAERQSPHAVLWWPVAMAFGVGAFFALLVDPPVWGGAALFAVGAVLRAVSKRVATLQVVAVTVMLAAVGFGAAQLRVASVAAPILAEEYGPGLVTGTVVIVEPQGSANRVTLDRLSLDFLSPDDTPERVRIRIPGSHGVPRVGDLISIRAVLNPPGRPVAPGAFDFQRYSFFRQLGGVGFAVGRWQSEAEFQVRETTVTDEVTALRAHVGERLATQMESEPGAVARALVTGERAAVPEPLQEAYRQAGLAHMLAISGLHMSLLAGLAFVAMRYALALVMPLAERYDTKKIAAVAAIGAAFFYLLLSGANVPAQRAFIMVTVVLAAVIIDRTALSLRTLAWAAMAVLLLQPEALVGASFQLSFAAVVALIAVYERVHIRARLRDQTGRLRPIKALFIYAAAVLLTDLIATSATGPFTAFHFQQVPSYSLLANLFAVPVMGLWIMPWGLAALVLMPVGLESLALTPMGMGIGIVNDIALFVSGLPGSTWTVPPGEVWALTGVGLGGLILCLWQGHLRWLGLVPLTIGLAQPWMTAPPHVLVNESAEVFAVQGRDGQLVFSPGRGERFTRTVWAERWGRSKESWLSLPSLTCDTEGCFVDTDYGRISIAFGQAAVVEDCGRAAVMIAAVPSWQLCRMDGVVIDRFDVWRHGGHAVWLTEDGAIVKRVSDYSGRRIWNRPTWRLPPAFD